MNLDCHPDAQMLEGACAAYEAAVDCYEIIQKQGRLVAKRVLDPTTNTLVVVNVKPHPAVAQSNAAWVLLKAFCSEFGLSPVSRPDFRSRSRPAARRISWRSFPGRASGKPQTPAEVVQ